MRDTDNLTQPVRAEHYKTLSGAPIEPGDPPMDPGPKGPENYKMLFDLPTVYSFGFEPEDLLAVYGALRVYLRTLVGQDQEDLEMLGRVVALMADMRPNAVKASKELSVRAVKD